MRAMYEKTRLWTSLHYRSRRGFRAGVESWRRGTEGVVVSMGDGRGHVGMFGVWGGLLAGQSWLPGSEGQGGCRSGAGAAER